SGTPQRVGQGPQFRMTLSRRTNLGNSTRVGEADPAGRLGRQPQERRHESENLLTRALRKRQARATPTSPLLDLTASNPTTVGLPYDASTISAALGSPAALVYEPDPLGLSIARAVVAGRYREMGIDVPSDRIALTASTSEAYAVLFKLLCDPG